MVLSLGLLGLALGCVKIGRDGGRAGLHGPRSRRGERRDGCGIHPASAHQRSSSRRCHDVVVLEARVRTLAEGRDVYADIRMDRRSATKHGVRGAMHTALRPWLGERLLGKGLIVYMHLSGRVEVVTKSTTLEDLVDAEAVDVVVQTESKLPAAIGSGASRGKPTSGGDGPDSADEGEQQPMFDGFKSLGDGTFYT